MVQAMIDKTLEEFGSIDILVSTAKHLHHPAHELHRRHRADWDKIFAVNLKANFFRSHRGRPRRGRGIPRRRQDGHHLLPARHLRHGEHRSVQHHEGRRHGRCSPLAGGRLHEFGIQVNGIAPGCVMTPMVEKVFADNPAQQEYVYSRTPSKVKMGSLQGKWRGNLLPLLSRHHLHHRSDADPRRRLVHPVTTNACVPGPVGSGRMQAFISLGSFRKGYQWKAR